MAMEPHPATPAKQQKMRVLVSCPCCGHTMILRNVMDGLRDVFEPRVRVHTVKGGGRGRIQNILTDLTEANGGAPLLRTIFRKLATQLEFAARRLLREADLLDDHLDRHVAAGLQVYSGLQAQAGQLQAYSGLQAQAGDIKVQARLQ